jgi:hypothetical protein
MLQYALKANGATDEYNEKSAMSIPCIRECRWKGEMQFPPRSKRCKTRMVRLAALLPIGDGQNVRRPGLAIDYLGANDGFKVIYIPRNFR